ncbi:hypothetical protein BGX26_009325 [Mortierella sp. AD094]|nr:hypothetical protein BGX26_009325 [Mortierella sp. AD094]
MLILIAGITGNLGQQLAKTALERGHSVRGLGRPPEKLNTELTSRLEKFITASAYYDVPALDRAMLGIDAVICAYAGRPELLLEGQLLLLRATERAGIKTFLAASWNADWRYLQFGAHENLNPFLSFRQQVSTTSTIKPIWILTGVLAEVFFSVPGHGNLSPEHHGIWDPTVKSVDIFGTGREKFDWTTEQDAAKFSIAILESPDAHLGGFYTVRSGCHSVREFKATYEKVRGTAVKVIEKGDLQVLESTALQARIQGSPNKYHEYIGYFYQLYTINGTLALRNIDNDRFPDVRATSLEEFLQQHPEI